MASPTGSACAATPATMTPTWVGRRARAYAPLEAAAKMRAPARACHASQPRAAAGAERYSGLLQQAQILGGERSPGRVQGGRHCRPQGPRNSNMHTQHAARVARQVNPQYPPCVRGFCDKIATWSATCATLARPGCRFPPPRPRRVWPLAPQVASARTRSHSANGLPRSDLQAGRACARAARAHCDCSPANRRTTAFCQCCRSPFPPPFPDPPPAP